ncbi:MAG: 16S rRNA (uracil(1498)-N(3))-methyltransferase [Alphaproteobacteria bacterium]|nr:16S rRNA (uracil(1498)-N(3))-methyltransferase [Alphaproteobacteria bacterium]
MQNIPRIFINDVLESGKKVPCDKNIIHYLRRVMRTDKCLVFNNGYEYNANVSDDNTYIIIGDKTSHQDPSNDMVLYFAPIKRIDDLLNMATQMGIGTFQPVITQRTIANHINWARQEKIIIEASEQSNRNSVPKILPPIKFNDIDWSDMVVADERAGHGREISNSIDGNCKKLFIGPEGGFSLQEFEIMDKNNVRSLSLGKTILRAEVAAVVAIAKVIK